MSDPMIEEDDTKSGPDTPAPVPKDPVPTKVVAAWTAPWVLLLGILLALAFVPKAHIPHAYYINGRGVALIAMIALAIAGLLRALDLVGQQKGKSWHTDGFLVALVLFWGLFPPCWFFIEYLLFDRNTFLLPPDEQAMYEAAVKTGKASAAEEIKGRYLASIKPYADLASKVWLAVGAALGAAIGLAKPK